MKAPERSRRGGLRLAVLLLGVASACTASAAPRPAPGTLEKTLPSETTAALDLAVRAELERQPYAGLSVGVSLGGQRWAKGYGYRDLARRLPATPRTTYRMASITKSFTAVAVLQLAERGKLDLDAEIQSLVPDYPRKPWPITVRQLLGHLGGVPNHPGPPTKDDLRRVSTREAIALFAGAPLVCEPGTEYHYTTWGYNLLGAAVESASGMRYRDYLRRHVFGPARMKHADLDDVRTRDAHHAVGYRRQEGKLVRSRFIDVSGRFAGGGTRASVDDLLRFGEAVLHHRLLRVETAREMLTPMRTADGRTIDYAMGFATYPQRGHFVAAHAGGQPETSTLLVLLPAHDLTIALAANTEGDGRALQRTAGRLIEILLEKGRVRRDAYASDPADAVLYEALNRIFTYGLASREREAWGSALWTAPAPPSPFADVEALLARRNLTADPRAALKKVRSAHQPRGGSLFVHVGVRMVRQLEDAFGPERVREYPALGPLAFFSDYLATCAAKGCAEGTAFGEELAADIGRLSGGWQRSAVPALVGARLDELSEPERLASAFEAARAVEGPRPDYAREVVELSARLSRRGDRADALRWLERAVALFPASAVARLALADAQLEAGDEAGARKHYQAAFEGLEGETSLSPEALLTRSEGAESAAIASGILRLAAELHPDHPGLQRALASRRAALDALPRAPEEGLPPGAAMPAPPPGPSLPTPSP